ncbi:PREDICTED: odorant receptor 46a, isoform A-like [Wasmannia auropunctata]|uniref:odorant receptor 46a, isoform A-like n=1 Tax=Wasmannia auropunctata TaxID=64793 RepID=UPI0005EF2346|nr:PREDICTED: odorant receptor 46a, isoform A-like [Wasmannia auropunctata]
MTQIMELILNADDPDAIGETLFNVVISLLACYKAIVLRLNHNSIIMLIDTFVDKPFKPMDLRESMIRQKFDKRITNNTLCYLVLVSITAFYMISLSFFTDFMNGALMYKAWLPFDSSTSVRFSLAYAHQILTLIFIGLVHPTCDNLICGLLLHICCQIEILEYRLSNITNGEENLRDCVDHHVHIFEYAYTVNRRFAKIIALQFAVSMLVVCANLYKLASIPNLMINGSIITLILYTACMLSQIFLYCWFGNELKLKSIGLATGIYKMEWFRLDIKTKKDLLLILRRTMIPIEFNSAVIVTLNLDSFVSLFKASYSAYNVLKRSQEHN